MMGFSGFISGGNHRIEAPVVRKFGKHFSEIGTTRVCTLICAETKTEDKRLFLFSG